MDDLIQIKGGNGEPPKLQDRELGYSKDKRALYIGTDDGNVKIGGADGVFYAVYGKTTGEEVNAALESGKIVACIRDNGHIMYLVSDWLTGNGFTFASMLPRDGYATLISASVSGANWSLGADDIALKETQNG